MEQSFLLGADVIDVIAKGQATASRAIRRGSGNKFIEGPRDWNAGTVTLYLDILSQLTYRELKDVLWAMEYWAHSEGWVYPSTYDVYSLREEVHKAFFCMFGIDGMRIGEKEERGIMRNG